MPRLGFRATHHLHARGIAVREYSMKRSDAIIEDLHRVREAIGKAHDFDVHRIAATVHRHEDESHESLVRELPKRTARPKKAS